MTAPGGGTAGRRPGGAPDFRAPAGDGRLLPLLAAALLWGPLLGRWSRAWSIAPDQAYGWAVPLLALFLARERLGWAPAPRPPAAAERRLAAAALGAGLLVYAAALPVLEANALWPTAQWGGGLAALAVTLAALTLAGGARWARHFAFPTAFVFTALTWPTPVKVWIVDNLVAVNARLAAELVSVLGHPALVSGNVIVVGTGLVGVDEACSGLRSLQAVGMSAWFCGELFRLPPARRLTLFFGSFLAAWAANVARTCVLTQIAAARGLAASERWHDRAGAAELVAALGAVLFLALRSARAARAPAAAAAPAPAAGSWRRRLRPAAWAVLLVCGAAEAGTQAWYRSHERGRGGPPLRHWELRAPDAAWRPTPVPARAEAILRSSAAGGLEGRDPASGARAWAFLVAWEGGAAQGENPEWHDPTICLPAAGATRVADWGRVEAIVGGQALPFTGYAFTADGRPLAVFFCHWDADLAKARVEGRLDPGDLRARRWRRVREGRRDGNVAHLTLILETADRAAAVRWLQEWAPRLLLLEPGPGRPGAGS